MVNSISSTLTVFGTFIAVMSASPLSTLATTDNDCTCNTAITGIYCGARTTGYEKLLTGTCNPLTAYKCVGGKGTKAKVLTAGCEQCVFGLIEGSDKCSEPLDPRDDVPCFCTTKIAGLYCGSRHLYPYNDDSFPLLMACDRHKLYRCNGADNAYATVEVKCDHCTYNNGTKGQDACTLDLDFVESTSDTTHGKDSSCQCNTDVAGTYCGSRMLVPDDENTTPLTGPCSFDNLYRCNGNDSKAFVEGGCGSCVYTDKKGQDKCFQV